MDTATWCITIVHAIDCKTAAYISSTLHEKFKTCDTIPIKISIKPFKDLKNINDITQENSFYIFIVSSIGKKCRSIRRFQRKLDKFPNQLNQLLFCIISLNDAQKESNKLYLTLKNKRKSIQFHEKIIYANDNDILPLISSINTHINQTPIIKPSKQSKQEIKDENVKKYDFTICYGTMTGNAKEICHEIASIAISQNAKYLINGPIPLNKFNIDINRHKMYLIIVISTTGDGEVPTNADLFYRKLKIKCLPAQKNKHKFNNLNYAILGLGDSNYSQFNAAAKNVDKLLSFLSQNKFYHTGYADDGTGLEDVVEPWKNGVMNEIQYLINKKYISSQSPLKIQTKPIFNYYPNTTRKKSHDVIYNFRILQKKNDGNVGTSSSRYELFDNITKNGRTSSYKAYDSNNQFSVSVLSSEYLAGESSKEKIINLTFKLPHGYSYSIGDILCIYPPNPTLLVEKLLNRLKFNASDVIFLSGISARISPHIAPFNLQHIPFKKEITICDIFTYCIDIVSIPKSSLFLSTLSTFCNDESDRNKLLNIASISYAQCSLFELFAEFSSCYPSLQCLLHFLCPLLARQYSICSSPAANNKVDEIDICLRVFDDGICSQWLHSLSIADKIYVYLKLSTTFKPPSNINSSSLILIATGTGVSVFKAFLQHKYEEKLMEKCGNAWNGSWRGIDMHIKDDDDMKMENEELCNKNASKCVLFFGCRAPDKDYLFQNEWKFFLDCGVLNNLFVAFSRYYENKVYVQHLLKENSLLISNLILKDNAYIYVCGGDSTKMAKDVENTIVQLIALHSKMSLIESTKYIQNMKVEKKYNVDVWNSI